MNQLPSPGDLTSAGAATQTLAYAVGLAGVVAGALVFRQGESVLAVAVWVLTFALGAVLIVASLLARAMAGLMARLSRIESDLAVVVADRGDDQRPPAEPGPREGWG